MYSDGDLDLEFDRVFEIEDCRFGSGCWVRCAATIADVSARMAQGMEPDQARRLDRMLGTESGAFKGVYERDTVEDAERYWTSFPMKLMKRRAVPETLAKAIHEIG